MLYLRSTCDDAGSELACNDDESGLQSGLQIELEADQAIFVFVDSFDAQATGPFGVHVLRADGSATCWRAASRSRPSVR
ncbi:MAG: hypothetical protein R3F60_27825 [bacterium]